MSDFAIIISPDESRGYIGVTSPPPYAFTDLIQTWHTHVFGSGEEPYFKVGMGRYEKYVDRDVANAKPYRIRDSAF